MRPVNHATLPPATAGGQSIDIEFRKKQRHSKDGDVQCVEYSGGQTIAWYALLAYLVEGSLPKTTSKSAPFVRAIIGSTNLLRHWNGGRTVTRTSRIEYFKVNPSTKETIEDHHLTAAPHGPPSSGGVCKIDSLTTIYMTLVTMHPMIDFYIEAAAESVDSNPQEPNDQVKGHIAIFKAVTGASGAPESPPGWENKVWRVEYEMETPHCGVLANLADRLRDPKPPDGGGATPTPPVGGGGTPTDPDIPYPGRRLPGEPY